MGRRCIGMDVDREFAQIAVWENARVRQAGKIGLTAEALRVFCDSLGPEDEVAIEATCNTHAIVRLIKPHVAQVQAILHRNLIARCPATDLFGVKGHCWLANQHLPTDEELAIDALVRQVDFHAQELRIIDAPLGRAALQREEILRLMTIPRVDATVALSLVAAVGDFRRFGRPEQLVSCLGLNPRAKQSGGLPASHGKSPSKVEERQVRAPVVCSSSR